MSNLADLLPAGGGQNNTDFVADGNISSGAPVILTSDGKAAAVSGSSVGQTFGSAVEFDSGTGSNSGMCYDTANDKIVICYRDEGNSDYGTAIVGTISGTSISFGTPVVFDSSSTSHHSCAFDASQGKVINCYRSTSNYGYGIVGEVSGTSISFGTRASFETGGNTYRINVCYLPPESKSVVFYRSPGGGTSGYPVAKAVSISGTTPSFGSVVTVASTGTYVNDSVYDENKQLIAFAYVNNSANVVAGNVVGISGTTVTVGTAVTFASENSDWITISYDSVLQKSLVTYSTSASALKAIIVAITDASTISADGTASDSGLTATNITSAFDVRAEKHGVFFRNQTTTRFCVIPVTTTAGGITWGSVTDLDTAGQWNHNIAVYDPDQQVLVNAGYEAYSPYASNAIAGYFAYDSTNLTSTNLLGIASGAISDTATGTINTWGSRNEVQTSLTIGSDYYVQIDGTISTTSTSPAQLIGKAITATQINIKDYTG
tara:strand:- start:3799 stop:5268 length:1470 start_codon:yes stop_codon:yes gene_type:complete